MKKILSIVLILLLVVLCLGSCVNSPNNGENPTTPTTTPTTTPEEDKYTLSFDAEGVESLEVVDGKAIGNLPAVPENPGYTGLWKVDGEVINAGTIYNYGEDKTAVPFYVAKDDTAYAVQVFIQVEDSYEDVSAQYAQLFGESVGTTGATVDISELAQANLPEHCILNTEESVLSGTIAGDGSLVLKVYYDLDGAFVLSFDVEGVSSLPVKFGEPMTNLPAVPEKVGYTGVWKIADEVITSETVYNYNGNRTATAVYTANTDTPYTVEVYMNGANVSFDFGTQFGMPCVGTTDTLVDISALAQANVPAHCALDESNSVLTGTIAGDGSLVLKVYYYNTDTVIFDAVADTNVVLDYEVRYGADEYSHRVQFHRTAWNGTVQLMLNGNRPVAPEGTTHVTFYYYTAHTSYNSVLNAAGKEITVGNWGDIKWNSFKLSIAQYNDTVWTLTDPQGNSQGKYIYLSNPVFTTEPQVWDGISTTTDVVYGTDEFSYTFNSNPTITATKVLLDMLGEDGEAISFYIKGTIAAPFNLVVFDPWDPNTNLANTVADEWVKFTLTREQVLNLVNNPSNYLLQIRSWDGGTYHISSFYEVKGPHIYTNYVYNNDAKCGVNGTETAQCDHCDKMTHTRTAVGTALSHSFAEYVSNNNATCTSNATETASCAHGCGTTDTREIANSTLSHVFTSYVSNGDGTETASCDLGCGTQDTRETPVIPLPIFDAVADTNVDLDYDIHYGEDEYSHRVQFHATAWNGTVQFKLNGNRPAIPEGATHVTFYYYTAHTSYGSVLNAAGKQITVGNYGTVEWKSFKLSIAQYNNAVWTLQDPDGNSQGKYIYLSNPVFTTEPQVWDGISTTTEVVYGTDEFSYTFNSNPNVFATKVLLNMLGDADAISFYIRGTIAAPFNFVVFDPWDANTNLANTVAGEWVKFTLTREQVLNLVNNPGNYSLQIRSWDGGSYYISSSYETYSAPLFEALADTSVEADTLNVYGDQAESYRVKFHATAWNGTVTFKLNQSKLPAIPEEATHVSIWYYMDHVTYNGCTLKIGSKTVVMENAEPYGWKEIRMTVAEYQSLISETWYLQDANGNSQGKFIYFSAPVFTTDLTPFNGLEKSTEVIYGNDEFSYKFEGNPFITAGAGLLKLLGDNNEISFYIQGNINAPFNFVINDPWDANTNLANTVAGEWVKFTLTREQVLNLVNNPSNFSVAIRDWSGGTRLFYISSYYEVK